MKRFFTLIAASAALSLSMSGCKDKAAHEGHSMSAASAEAGEITVTKAMLRPPLPGRTTAMATFTIENSSAEDDRLIAVSSPVAQTVEIHTIITEGNIKRMRRMENGLSVPAKGSAMLMHGGDHIMLFETALEEGAKTVPLTLTFEKQGPVEVEAMINDGTMGDHSGH